VIEGYRRGFRTIFITCSVLAAAGFCGALFLMPHLSLDREDDKALKEQSKAWLEAEKKQKSRTENEALDSQSERAPAATTTT
jgi:predicted MFS family arabinose efflux permease